MDKSKLKDNNVYKFTLVEEDSHGKLYERTINAEFRGYEPDERRGTCDFVLQVEGDTRGRPYDSGDVLKVERFIK